MCNTTLNELNKSNTAHPVRRSTTESRSPGSREIPLVRQSSKFTKPKNGGGAFRKFILKTPTKGGGLARRWVANISMQLLMSVAAFAFFFVYLFILHRLSQFLHIGNHASPKVQVTERSIALRAADSHWTRGELVHIVLTRFQQHQGKLKDLGMARIELFKTFCLPTMAGQTNQNFLWIIRTDDELDPHVLKAMQDLLRPHPNYLLVKSNKRRDEAKGFRDFDEYSDMLDMQRIVAGEAGLAVEYFNAAKSRVVVETRLDADDGLHLEFIDIIQKSAKARFFDKKDTLKDHYGSEEVKRKVVLTRKKEASWVYWCADHHFEWYSDKSKQTGTLDFTREMYCITPGLTIGYAPEVDLINVPKNQHWKLHRRIGPCYHEDDSQCLMHLAHIRPGAIRARTPTSAGMKNVGEREELKALDAKAIKEQEQLNELRWQVLRKSMGIDTSSATNVNNYMQDHLVEIARDNLKGQCSVGHSCKKNAKEKLKALLDPNYVPNITNSEKVDA